MADTKQAPVTVTMQNGKLTCTPDWVHLYWKNGPQDIRWVFQDLPKEAAGAVVEFLAAVPTKYGAPPPDAPGPFRPRGVHGGFGSMATPLGPLPDLITTANTQETGYFYYNVTLLDAAGGVIAEADPGGDNQPEPPVGG